MDNKYKNYLLGSIIVDIPIYITVLIIIIPAIFKTANIVSINVLLVILAILLVMHIILLRLKNKTPEAFRAVWRVNALAGALVALITDILVIIAIVKGGWLYLVTLLPANAPIVIWTDLCIWRKCKNIDLSKMPFSENKDEIKKSILEFYPEHQKDISQF